MKMNISVTSIISDVQVSIVTDQLRACLRVTIPSCHVQGSPSCNIDISIIIFYSILSPRLGAYNQYHKYNFLISVQVSILVILLSGHPGCGIIIYGGKATPRLSLNLARAQPPKLPTSKLLVINNSFLPFSPPRDCGSSFMQRV